MQQVFKTFSKRDTVRETGGCQVNHQFMQQTVFNDFRFLRQLRTLNGSETLAQPGALHVFVFKFKRQ